MCRFSRGVLAFSRQPGTVVLYDLKKTPPLSLAPYGCLLLRSILALSKECLTRGFPRLFSTPSLVISRCQLSPLPSPIAIPAAMCRVHLEFVQDRKWVSCVTARHLLPPESLPPAISWHPSCVLSKEALHFTVIPPSGIQPLPWYSPSWPYEKLDYLFVRAESRAAYGPGRGGKITCLEHCVGPVTGGSGIKFQICKHPCFLAKKIFCIEWYRVGSWCVLATIYALWFVKRFFSYKNTTCVCLPIWFFGPRIFFWLTWLTTKVGVVFPKLKHQHSWKMQPNTKKICIEMSERGITIWQQRDSNRMQVPLTYWPYWSSKILDKSRPPSCAFACIPKKILSYWLLAAFWIWWIFFCLIQKCRQCRQFTIYLLRIHQGVRWGPPDRFSPGKFSGRIWKVDRRSGPLKLGFGFPCKGPLGRCRVVGGDFPLSRGQPKFSR